jgi:hypothetical protein
VAVAGRHLEVAATSRVFLDAQRKYQERMFLFLLTLNFFVFIVSLLALTIAEDQTTQRRRQKPQPILGVVSDTNSVR